MIMNFENGNVDRARLVISIIFRPSEKVECAQKILYNTRFFSEFPT